MTTLTYRAAGFTDDITDCDVCGKVELKGTVRLVILDAEHDEVGDIYAGVTCAARLASRKPAQIRTEAARADRARTDSLRAEHRAWQDAHSREFCSLRDAALGKNATFDQISAWRDTDAARDAMSRWSAANPEPPRP